MRWQSLQLSIRLQEEELRWQELAMGGDQVGELGDFGGDPELDEDMQLALRLQHEEEEAMAQQQRM